MLVTTTGNWGTRMTRPARMTRARRTRQARRARRIGAAARLVVCAAASVLAGGLLIGCQDAQSGSDDRPGRVLKKHDDYTVFERADGLRVELRYRDGRGLVERHRKDGDWSDEHLVHRTKTAPCQGIEVSGRGELVAVIADFAAYCRDGDPPMENVAAVGRGKDLTQWAAKGTQGSDGWEKVRFGAGTVEFRERWSAGTSTLTWTAGKGFGPERRQYDPLRDAYLGTWKAADGSHQLVFTQAGQERPPRLTITTLRGAPCTAEVPVQQVDRTTVEMEDEPRITSGSKQKFCGPEPFETEYDLARDDGPLTLTDYISSPRKQLMTYERAR